MHTKKHRRFRELTVLAAAALALLPNCSETVRIPNCAERAVFGDPAQSPYVLPYPINTAYCILQSYCTVRGHHNQLAYDFMMDIGTPVGVARGGQVMGVVNLYPDSDLDPSHENHVFIRHGDGTVAFYAHLQLNSILVNVDDRVERGQPLALSGSCGTPVPDLHFQVFQSWPPEEGYDVAVNFCNAEGQLDSRGGLMTNACYLALPY